MLIFKFLIYALFVRQNINLTQFLRLMVLGSSKSFFISIDIIGFRVPTQKLRDFPFSNASHPLQIAPTTYVPLQKIHFVVTLMSSEGKLSHLLIFDIIISLFL
jgi:hypothetical protein